MTTNNSEDQESAKSLLSLIKAMTPTFEVSSGGVKFTDGGVTAIIPTATSRQVVATKRLK